MSNVLPDVRSVIAELGGVPATAIMFKVTEPAVFNWIGRDRFPAHTYFGIRDRLATLGRSAPDDLWRRQLPASQPAQAHA